MNNKCWKDILKIFSKLKKCLEKDNVEIVVSHLSSPNILKKINIHKNEIVLWFSDNDQLNVYISEKHDCDQIYSESKRFKIYTKKEDKTILKELLK